MIKLTFLGHSAFLLEADGGNVLIDPFLTGNSTAACSADDLSPQTILLTHAHNDHVGDTIAIAKRTNAKVIATYELATWLSWKGVGNATGGNMGGTIAFDGGTVKFVPAWHTSSFMEGESFVAPGVPAGLIVTFGDRTIYFAGDTCLFGDMSLIGEAGLDVAVLPIGDNFTMGPAEAARATRLLKATTVIPCHYNTFPQIKQDPNEFKRLVEEQGVSTCVVLQPGASHQL